MSVKSRSIILLLVFILGVSGLTACGSFPPSGGATLREKRAASLLPDKTAETEQPTPPAGDTAGISNSDQSYPDAEIDTFFETSWRELMLRDPDWVLAEGLSGTYGMDEIMLSNLSDEYQLETHQLIEDTLQSLRGFDRSQLSPDRQISYDVYEWYLEDQLQQAEFLEYRYLVTVYPLISVPEGTAHFFTDLHPITNRQEAEDYLTRLDQIDERFDVLIKMLKQREESGIVPPRFAVQGAIPGLRRMAYSNPKDTPYFTAYWDRVHHIQALAEAEKQALIDAAERVISESVLPAYQELVEYMEHQQTIAPTDEGVWQFKQGLDYYDCLLKHHTSTDLDADQIHQLGLEELERIHAEIYEVFKQLGYPLDESLPALYDRVAEGGGYIPASQVLETYESIITDAENNLGQAFDLRPQAELAVISSSIRGLYVHGSLDGTRPGAFHAGPATTSEQYYAMPTLAYHEGVPGHHFQVSLAMESDLPLFRNLIGFTGFSEGWALYAEKLASELGWYDDNPYGNLGRLQGEALRAARLVVDTGIHAMGWSFAQASDFLSENTGFDRGDSVNPDHQIARYIVYPGQATAYKVGMIRILELRQQAQEQLGDEFNLKEFHSLLLSNGSMPLEVLERLVEEYLAGRQ